MKEQVQIKPNFHYIYHNESTILDSQYSIDGNMLGVCTSNGEIFIYEANHTQDVTPEMRRPVVEYKTNSSNPILKLTWSYSRPNRLAICTVDKHIFYCQCVDRKINILASKTTEVIPVSAMFCPDQPGYLAVGFSNGKLALFDENLSLIDELEAHEETINSVCWQLKVTKTVRNKWIRSYFPTFIEGSSDQTSLLLTGSSDSFIKMWRLENKKLIYLCEHKAHDKQIREVQWKPNYFRKEQYILSCGEDGLVKFWRVEKQNNKMKICNITTTNLEGSVYKAQYNVTGEMIAISFWNIKEQRVQTKIMSEKDGVLNDVFNFNQ